MAAPSGTSWGATNGSGTSQDCIGVYVSTSSTATTVTVTMQVWYWSKYSIRDSSNNFYMAWDNNAWTNLGAKTISHNVASGGGWSTANQTLIYSGSKTYTRGTSAYTGRAWGQKSGIDKIPGTASHSVAFTIPAKDSYTVNYNANGGTGAPGAQTKWYGTNISLSSAQPTRTGYTFKGWSTTNDSTVEYQPGATYSANAGVTLYAVWEVITYKVTYNANGGTTAPAAQVKTHGVDLILSKTIPKRTNYNFKGWGASEGSTTIAYAAGATYKNNEAITLYAIWEIAYIKPRITEFTVDRCNSTGALDEEGTYALVKFKWETDKALSSIKINYKMSTASTWTETTVTGSGTSGTVSKVVGGGKLDTEYEYNIQTVVTDTMGSNDENRNIAPMAFDMDFLSGGGGVALGQPASRKGFDVNMQAFFKKNVEHEGTVTIKGNEVVAKRGYVLKTTNLTTDKRWFKLASINLANKTNYDASMMCLVKVGFGSNTKYGLLAVTARTEKPVRISSAKLEFISDNGIVLDNIVMCHDNVSIVEIWARLENYYPVMLEVLQETNRTRTENTEWILYNTASEEGELAPTSGYTQVKPTSKFAELTSKRELQMTPGSGMRFNNQWNDNYAILQGDILYINFLVENTNGAYYKENAPHTLCKIKKPKSVKIGNRLSLAGYALSSSGSGRANSGQVSLYTGTSDSEDLSVAFLTTDQSTYKMNVTGAVLLR